MEIMEGKKIDELIKLVEKLEKLVIKIVSLVGWILILIKVLFGG